MLKRSKLPWLLLSVILISCDTGNNTEMAKPQIGDMAPEFELKDSNGNLIRLKDFRGNQSVVVYFYPKDDTPGCTAQACSFRDSYDDFVDAGSEVLGISSDGSSSHKGFAGKHKLQFILLSDPTGDVRKSYGAYDLFGMMPGRVTFVIDKEGKIIHKFDSQLKPTKHIEEALNKLKATA